MLYHAYDAHNDILAPFRLFAETAHSLLDPRWLVDPNWLGGSAFLRSAAAALNMFSNGGVRHERPDFGIDRVTVGGVETDVTEEAVAIDPFCRLVRFRKADAPEQPRLLVVAPLSGHFATLLRGTVERFCPTTMSM